MVGLNPYLFLIRVVPLGVGSPICASFTGLRIDGLGCCQKPKPQRASSINNHTIRPNSQHHGNRDCRTFARALSCNY